MKTTKIIALTLTASLAACAAEKGAPKPATPVRVAAAQSTSAPRGHRYSATLQPRAQVGVAFRSAGYVDDIAAVGVGRRPLAPAEIASAKSPATAGSHLLQAGDRVTKGALLATVRQQDTSARVAQARAALAEAQAAAVRSRLDAARAESLFASASLTRPDLDGARAGLAMSDARTAAAQAQLEAAVLSHGDTRLVAPLSGVVLSRSIEEGALVGPGSVGFVIADTDTMKAVFGVPDTVVQSLRIGDAIPVAAQAAPGVTFPGRITALSPSADPTSRVFDVEVTIPNAGGRLKTGMVAVVEVKADAETLAAPSAPSVPLWSVLKSPRGDGYAVYVVENGAARAREVKLGGIAGNQVSVLEGIRSGESVVVTGAALLTDGEAVRVIP